jgi:plasmid stabilization system protein ParE
MTYKVILLRRAEQDLREATEYIAERAPAAAERWFNEFVVALQTLSENPERCGLAPGNGHFSYQVRQFFYRTRSKYPTRALFTIAGDEVRILMIRRPGQAPVSGLGRGSGTFCSEDSAK